MCTSSRPGGIGGFFFSLSQMVYVAAGAVYAGPLYTPNFVDHVMQQSDHSRHVPGLDRTNSESP